MIDVEVKGWNKLSELAKFERAPMRDLVQYLATAIRYRVREGGQAPDGRPWTQLGTYRRSTESRDPSWRWWVSPEAPQPKGYFRRIEGGEWDGWCIYENFDAYMRLLPREKRLRKWYRTGQLWNSMRARVMAANRGIISFYGSRPQSKNNPKRIANRDVARLAGLFERFSVMQYSPDEADVVVRAIEENMTAQWGAVLQAAAEGGPRKKIGVGSVVGSVRGRRIPAQTL
jgi:hypothetical protein